MLRSAQTFPPVCETTAPPHVVGTVPTTRQQRAEAVYILILTQAPKLTYTQQQTIWNHIWNQVEPTGPDGWNKQDAQKIADALIDRLAAQIKEEHQSINLDGSLSVSPLSKKYSPVPIPQEMLPSRLETRECQLLTQTSNQIAQNILTSAPKQTVPPRPLAAEAVNYNDEPIASTSPSGSVQGRWTDVITLPGGSIAGK